MTVTATRWALADGAAFNYLDATDDGAGVYRRVGYVGVGGWRCYYRLA